jgi:hypothetical protein
MRGMRNGAQLRAQAAQSLRRHIRRKIQRQPALGDPLDGGENIRRPAAVKPARHGVRGQRQANPPERVGEHGGGNRFTVDKHAIAIEDDHRPLRCPAERFGRRRRDSRGA